MHTPVNMQECMRCRTEAAGVCAGGGVGAHTGEHACMHEMKMAACRCVCWLVSGDDVCYNIYEHTGVSEVCL